MCPDVLGTPAEGPRSHGGTPREGFPATTRHYIVQPMDYKRTTGHFGDMQQHRQREQVDRGDDVGPGPCAQQMTATPWGGTPANATASGTYAHRWHTEGSTQTNWRLVRAPVSSVGTGLLTRAADKASDCAVPPY